MEVVETPNNMNAGIGSRLKKAREAKGLSIDNVSDEIKVLKRHLEAIERDDYDSLPQAAFTRGFIVSYAKFLKLDVDSIVREYELKFPSNNPTSPVELKESVQSSDIAKLNRDKSTQKTQFGRFSIVLALVGLAALAYFVSSHKKSQDTDTPESVSTLDAIHQKESPQTADTSTTQSETTTDTGTSSDTANTTSSNSTASTSTSQTDANATAQTTDNISAANAITQQPAPEAPVVVDPNAKPAELVFWVRKNTNITITDQTGAVVMSGIKSRGEHKAVGKPPFKLNISNAANVALNMDKIPQKRVLRDNTQPDGSARFTLTK